MYIDYLNKSKTYFRNNISIVHLKMFDVLGKEMVKLLNLYKPAGICDVKFNSSGISSGVYFYKLQVYPAGGGAGNYVEVKKMLLIK